MDHESLKKNSPRRRVLALEPYYGGSHQAFLDGWVRGSRHRFTLLTLPPYKWKWRMRHAAITFAEQAAERAARGEGWDVVFCSDMLNLAEFRGLAPPPVGRLPAVVYFHENQLTYPVRSVRERDLHFGMSNLTTALAATQIWFNSAFHRDDFLGALSALLQRMPDFQPFAAVGDLRRKSLVQSPGIEPVAPAAGRRPGPLRIVWAARWERDKNPETFFRTLARLAEGGVDFRVSVLGESFRQVPAIFERARRHLAGRIERWGYQERREDYLAALRDSDVVVSTARHEFFGLSVVEAIAAGCRPLLPRRLSYPEILEEVAGDEAGAFLYDGSAGRLAARLGKLAAETAAGGTLAEPSLAARAAERFGWRRRRAELDEALARACGSCAGRDVGVGYDAP